MRLAEVEDVGARRVGGRIVDLGPDVVERGVAVDDFEGAVRFHGDDVGDVAAAELLDLDFRAGPGGRGR